MVRRHERKMAGRQVVGGWPDDRKVQHPGSRLQQMRYVGPPWVSRTRLFAFRLRRIPERPLSRVIRVKELVDGKLIWGDAVRLGRK